MILVSIFEKDEMFVIQLTHRIDYRVEKRYRRTKTQNMSTPYVFVQIFLAMLKLIIKEVFER